MPNGKKVKAPLFDFSAQGASLNELCPPDRTVPAARTDDACRTELSVRPDLVRILVPSHARAALLAGPEHIDVERFEPVDLAPLRLWLE